HALSIKLGKSPHAYSVDMNRMEQTNLSTGFARSIRRDPTAARKNCALWEWDAGKALGWTRYDEGAAQQLEIAHSARRPSTVLMHADTPYLIDLKVATHP
ncbi:hypothetical protein T492DRAFT_871343, partial [Pavlovales sp. CCMP2436]